LRLETHSLLLISWDSFSLHSFSSDSFTERLLLRLETHSLLSRLILFALIFRDSWLILERMSVVSLRSVPANDSEKSHFSESQETLIPRSTSQRLETPSLLLISWDSFSLHSFSLDSFSADSFPERLLLRLETHSLLLRLILFSWDSFSWVSFSLHSFSSGSFTERLLLRLKTHSLETVRECMYTHISKCMYTHMYIHVCIHTLTRAHVPLLWRDSQETLERHENRDLREETWDKR